MSAISNLSSRMIDLHLNDPGLASSCRISPSNKAPRNGATPCSIDPSAVKAALPVLRAEGYQTLKLGGGQPLLHSRLTEIASFAQSLGMRTKLHTNVNLLGLRQVDRLGERVDMYCLDLDGVSGGGGGSGMFADPRQTDNIMNVVELLVTKGKSVSLNFTLNACRLRDLTELYVLGEQLGISEIRANPAVDAASGLIADGGPAERLYAMVALLDAAPGGPSVRTRLCRQDDPNDAKRLAPLISETSVEAPLAEQIDPLVITCSGAIEPFVHGIDRFHHIGLIGEDLEEQIAVWRRYSRPELAQAAAQAMAMEPDRVGYVDFQTEMATRAERRYTVA